MIIEKLREEIYGGPIKRFVGLKRKIPSWPLYTFTIFITFIYLLEEDNEGSKKARCININIADGELKYED